jgi:hypothetical protein
MRTVLMAGLVAAASLAGLMPSSAGVLYEGPWCFHESQGRDGVVSRCDMRSYEMCRAEMSARGGTYCTENPYYWAQARAHPDPRKAYKRSRAVR